MGLISPKCVRILLDTVNKEFVQRDLRLASEFEMLKMDFQQLDRLSKGRIQTKSQSPEIVFTIPVEQVFVVNGQVSPAFQNLAKTLINRMNSLQRRPSLRIETHTSAWNGRQWRSDAEARERSLRHSTRLVEIMTDLGADPQLMTVGSYGLRKPLINERTVPLAELPAAARSNDRIILILERRQLAMKMQSKERSGP